MDDESMSVEIMNTIMKAQELVDSIEALSIQLYGTRSGGFGIVARARLEHDNRKYVCRV